MKKDIHPKYNNIIIECACGTKHATGSVLNELKVEICSQCHPFFTGNDKTLDSTGRVDKFNKRVAATKK